MKTTNRLSKVPMGQHYIKIDVGNEFLYVYGINDKTYIEVTHSLTGKRKVLKG
jgi:hypothetical protein